MTTALLKLCDSALTHRRLTLLIWALLIAISCAGLFRLDFSYDYRSFFDPANPELQAFEAIEQQFTATDSVNFILHTAKGDVFEADTLETLDWLTERALDIPFATRSQSAANFQYSYVEDDDLVVEPLLEPLRQNGFDNPALRALVKARAKSEPALMGRLLSQDFKAAQVVATIRMPTDEGIVLPQIQEEIDAIKRELSARAPDLRLATTGVIVLSQTFFEITVRDMVMLFPIITLAIFCLLAWFFRSWKASALCLTIITLAIVMAMGLAGWAGVKLTPATGPVPIVIMTVALVDSVHLLAGYFASTAKGNTTLDAARYSIQHNLRAILLTSLTTAIGFLTLNFSDTPPFREFGNIAATGTVIAMALSLTLLPCFLLLGGHKNTADKPAHTFIDFRVFSQLSRTLRWPIIILSAAAVFLSVYAVTQLKVRDNFVEWVGYSHPFRANAEFIQETLPSLFTQQYALTATQANAVTTPAYLKDLEAFATFIKEQDGVAHVLSFDTIMRRLNKNLHDDDPRFETLPSNAEEAAQYLLLYEMSLPFGEDLTTLLTIDRSATRVVVTLEPQSSADMQALRGRILSWAEQTLENATAAAGTGTNMIFAELTRSNTQSMLWGSLVAAIGIGLALIITLANARLGLLSLIPNITPPLYAFGIWALLVGDLGLYGAFVVATALGLIVDATVHMLEKYQALTSTGSIDPVADMLDDVGPAILISSIVLIAGFGVLTFSSFAIIAQLAKLVVLTLCLALVTDFLLLPALLHLLHYRQKEP
jgi:hypothetical protein